MEYRVKLTARAQRDVAAIYEFLGPAPSQAAQAWYKGLRNAIRSLRNRPGRCPVTLEDGELRHLLYGHKPHIYRVIFRIIEPQQVDVLHIRHGAREDFEFR